MYTDSVEIKDQAMSYNDGKLSVLFFFSKERKETLEELAEMAGCLNVRSMGGINAGSYNEGEWGNLFVDIFLQDFTSYRVLRFNFSEKQLISMYTENEPYMSKAKALLTINEDPAFPIIKAFKSACEKTSPEVAV